MQLSVIDISLYFEHGPHGDGLEECKKAALALEQYSAICIRDPRVSEESNSQFLDLMEEYFSQPEEIVLEDARPDFGYQVGVTPPHTECPVVNDHLEEKPHQITGPDPKWRFFCPVNVSPKDTKFPTLNASPVVPRAFPEWTSKMHQWGKLLLSSVEVVAEMVAVGLGLDKATFRNLTKFGPHLLAPTGSDLSRYGNVGTVLAGFHTDLNFLTIHGKSRFPGLHIWKADGKKVLVKIPDGTLLVQAGKQMQLLTSGKIMAGFHEVVVVPETISAMKKQEDNNRPLWRISSTLFFHISSDVILEGLVDGKDKYEPILAGNQVLRELGLLNLSR